MRFSKEALVSGLVLLFDDYSRDKLEHVKKEKHEVEAECVPFHMPTEFNGFMLWLVAKEGEYGKAKSASTGDEGEHMDSSEARKTMEGA